MKIAKRAITAVDLFRKLPAPEGTPAVTQMRGNPKSKWLLIAPPCTDIEYSANMPLVSGAAEIFHNILEFQGMHSNQFLVVSCSRYGKKANKASTAPIVQFVKDCAARNLFTHYICVGDLAFKFIFGSGKSPSMNTLAGSTIYVPQTGHKPLFVFPSIAPLHPERIDGDDRGNFLRMRIADETVTKFYQYTAKLKLLLQIK